MVNNLMGIDPSPFSDHKSEVELSTIFNGDATCVDIDYDTMCAVSDALRSISTEFKGFATFDEETLRALGFDAIDDEGIVEIGFEPPTGDQRKDRDQDLCMALIMFEVARRIVVSCASIAKRDKCSREHLANMRTARLSSTEV